MWLEGVEGGEGGRGEGMESGGEQREGGSDRGTTTIELC